MTVEDIPLIFREAMALHEAFRRMGFEPEEIHVRYVKNDFLLGVIVDGKEGFMRLGILSGMSTLEFTNRWEFYSEWFNNEADSAELHAIWVNSIAFEEYFEFEKLLGENGVPVRRLTCPDCGSPRDCGKAAESLKNSLLN